MYGLVNKAVESLVRSQFGGETWEKIRAKAGVDTETFLSMEPYPDAVTYGLVVAASEVLGAPVPALLEAFGEYWTMYTAREGYGELLALFGSTLEEFLGNLDAMHTRVGMTFPKLRPPSFVLIDQGGGVFELEYHSSREGLAPMVVGLLKGLGKSFQQAITIEHTRARADAGHDVFHLVIGPKGSAA